jgi:hypothetical protein
METLNYEIRKAISIFQNSAYYPYWRITVTAMGWLNFDRNLWELRFRRRRDQPSRVGGGAGSMSRIPRWFSDQLSASAVTSMP